MGKDDLEHTGVMGMHWGVRGRGGQGNLHFTSRRVGKPKNMSKSEFDKQYAKETGGSSGKSKAKGVGIWPAKPNKLIRILAQLPGESNSHFDKEYNQGLKAEKAARLAKGKKAAEYALAHNGKKQWSTFNKIVSGDPNIPMAKKVVNSILIVGGAVALYKLTK